MAIKFSSGLIIGSKEPIDSRFVLTKAEMLAMNPARMPAIYIAICKDLDDPDRGKLFIYDNRNKEDPDPITGRFRKYQPDIDPRIDEILIRLDKADADIEEALAEIEALNEHLNENFLTKYEIAETYEAKADLESDMAVKLPAALVKAMEEQKDTIESSVSGILPGALAKALDVQADKNSGLVVDEDGNIKVSLNEEHLEIIDNKIDLALECIQAIDGN